MAIAVVVLLAACENPQSPVVCGEIPEQRVHTDAASSLIVCVDDPNDEVLSYAVETSDQEVATATIFGSTVVVKGVAPGTALVTVTATDPTGLEATARFRVVVPNRAPAAVRVLPEHRIPVGDAVTVDVSTYFRDPDGQELAYAAAPSDTRVVTVSGTGNVMTITARSKGIVSVAVTATDPGGLTARQDFAVKVPNRAPVGVDSIPERTVAVGDTLEEQLARYFSDPDEDPLVYSASSQDTTRVTVSISSSTALVTALAKGAVTVTVTATDAEGLSAVQEFSVIAPNRAPLAVWEIPAATVEVEEAVTLRLSPYFSDPDDDSLVFTAAVDDAAVAGVSVSGEELTVAGSAKGAAIVTVTATDTEGLTATQEFGVTVPNRGPLAVGAVPAQTVAAGEAASLSLFGYFTDPDGDPLTFTATASDTAVATVSVHGGDLTVAAAAKGEATATITATDTEGLSAAQVFTVTVPNRAPAMEGEMPPRTLQAGDTATVALSPYFSDPDGDPLTFAATASDTTVAMVSVRGGDLTVAAAAKGEATVAITATDMEGLSAAQVFTVTVPNREPLAVGAIPAETVAVGRSARLDISGYFTDPDGDALACTVAVADSAVVKAVMAGKTVAVTALAKGKASVTITATDTEGLSAAQVIVVTVPNRAPVVEDRLSPHTLEAGELATLRLSPYFSDPDGDLLVFVATASDGAVTGVAVSGDTLTVAAKAKGTATVTVAATDTEGLVAAQEFTATVPNRAPAATRVIQADTVAAGETTTLDLSGYFADPDADPLTFAAAASDPAVAGSSVSGALLAVTAIARGRATLTVTANDPDGLAATQEFTVTVPNRPPVPTGSTDEQVIEAGDTTTLELSSHFTDPDGDRLVFAVAISDTSVAAVSASETVMTIAAFGRGVTTVTITASDPEGLAAAQDLAVTVSGRAPLPVGMPPPLRVTEGGIAKVDPSAYFADPDGDVLEFSAASSDLEVARTWVSRGTVLVRAVAKGSATVTITARDPDGLSATRQFKVSVRKPNGSGSNRPPRAVGRIVDQDLEEDDSREINASAYFSDPDNDDLTFTASSSDDGVATVSLSGDRATVRSVASGTTTMTISARDPHGLTASLEFEVTVSEATEENRPPRATGKILAQTLEEDDYRTIDASAYFSDPDADDLTFTASSSDDGVATVSLSGDAVTLQGEATGTAAITIAARDPDSLSASLEFEVTVSEATEDNRPPTAVGTIPAKTMEEGDSVTIDASAHFSDPDNDDLTFTASSSDDDLATVSLSGDRATVRSVASGTTTMTISARDPHGLTASLEFEVTVSEATEENRPPRATGKILAQTLEEDDYRTIDASAYFSDPDADDLTFTASSSDDGVATVSLSGDAVTLQGEATGTAAITIAARDPDSLSASLEFEVTVSEATEDNRPPTAVGTIPAKTMEEGDSVTIDASAHFSDPDNDDLTFTASSSDDDLATAAVSGPSVTVRSEGPGTATVTITASDPEELTASLEFDVTIAEVPEDNRPPVVIGTMGAKALEKGDSMKTDADSYFSDPDGDDLVFRAASSDSGVVIPGVTGSELVMSTVDTGSATVSITAEDPEQLSVTLEVEVTVDPTSPRVSICNRTPAVRDLLLRLAGATSCASVKTSELASISRLRLHNSGISSLRSQDFAELGGLTVLELYGNNLSELPADVFSGLSSLTILQLSYNRLESLPTDVFSGLSSLVELNVGHNALTELPEGVFTGLTSLRWLFLNGNEIAALPPQVLSDLNSLRVLFLYGNNFATLPTEVFSGLTSLELVTLEDCELTTLTAGTFSGLPSLSRVELSGNSLNALPSGLFAGASGLLALTLSDNRLEELPDSLLNGLSSLRTLWLHGNGTDPMPVEISLASVEGGRVKATVSTGAPFKIEVPLTIENGTIEGDSTITIPAGSLESASFTVNPGEGGATVDVGTLPSPPGNRTFTSSRGTTRLAHYGYRLTRSPNLPLTVNEE